MGCGRDSDAVEAKKCRGDKGGEQTDLRTHALNTDKKLESRLRIALATPKRGERIVHGINGRGEERRRGELAKARPVSRSQSDGRS